MMRLFIGIRPSEEIRTALVGAQEFLVGHGVTGAYLTRENLHMTLAYIGEHPEPYSVLDAMETVPFEPFGITFTHLGTFRESIVWGGTAPSAPLDALAKRLRYCLSKADIPFDSGAFTPHFTLLRHADFSRGIPPVEITPVSMTVHEITIYRSDRGKNGMIYTPVGIVEG
jgi:2'-5' RNA ligase